MNAVMAQIAAARASGRRCVWVDHFAYTRERLLGGAEIPWNDLAASVDYLGQCERLLGSNACLLPVADYYVRRLAEDTALREAMRGRRLGPSVLRAMLGDEDARADIAALASVLATQSPRPLVLVLPAAGDWLRAVCRAAHGEDCEVDAEDIERAAIYVADFLRCFAASAVAGILILAKDVRSLPPGAHQPVANVASHYRWSVGVLDLTGGAAGAEGFDYRIAPQGSGDAQGVLLADSLATTDTTSPLCHVVIAADAVPEAVLEAIAVLRGA
ncbi:MAG TPA: hypothetical protein PLN31_15680 [Azoarcus taiwanensis]|nr:hypothetical protein [Azoarcus taiwanensis]